MAWLFEGSCFVEVAGVNLTPLVFQKEPIQYQYNFMQLMSILFKVG